MTPAYEETPGKPYMTLHTLHLCRSAARHFWRHEGQPGRKLRPFVGLARLGGQILRARAIGVRVGCRCRVVVTSTIWASDLRVCFGGTAGGRMGAAV